jgi:hypothetical protein
MAKPKKIIFYDIHETLLEKFKIYGLEEENKKVYNMFKKDKKKSKKNPNIRVEILTCTPYDVDDKYNKRFGVKINTSNSFSTINKKSCIEYKINFLKEFLNEYPEYKIILKDNIASDLNKEFTDKNITILDPN